MHGLDGLQKRLPHLEEMPAAIDQDGGRHGTRRNHGAYYRSRNTYWAPRVRAKLHALGIRCARKRVARLVREAGLVGRGEYERASLGGAYRARS